MVLNGIVWKFRTGVAWRDVPERYGPWTTLYTRFRRRAADGTFERILRAAWAKVDAAGDIDWLVSIASTIVRAHQHTAGARRKGSATGLERAASTAGHRPSTATSTSTGTSWNCASTTSSRGAASPPGTTRQPDPTEQPSPSHHF